MTMIGVIGFVAYDDITKNKNAKDELLGKEFIIRNDTIQVVDYVFWGANYRLSNGVVVDEQILRVLEEVE